MNDTFCMQLFCGQQWKSLAQIKAHLISKNTQCSGAGSVRFGHAIVQQMLQQIMVLLHTAKLINLTNRNKMENY